MHINMRIWVRFPRTGGDVCFGFRAHGHRCVRDNKEIEIWCIVVSLSNCFNSWPSSERNISLTKDGFAFGRNTSRKCMHLLA